MIPPADGEDTARAVGIQPPALGDHVVSGPTPTTIDDFRAVPIR